MTNRQIYYPKLAQRVAQEAQLLAEEKWIIQALKKIKEQRNSLQIERLHLENKRTQLLKESGHSKESVPPSPCRDEAPTTDEANLPSTSVVTMMQTSTGNSEEYFPLSMDYINNEELNLSVTNSVFTNQCHDSYDMEEEEEDLDNCVIDMNMLMNGGP